MDTQHPNRDKIRAELAELSAEMDKLKAKAAAAKSEQAAKLNHYLDALEDTRDNVITRLESIKDSGSDAMDDIKLGLQEAKQRLAIAKRAAQARFH
jgi:hypothetical protein